jgi:hypothetical protein
MRKLWLVLVLILSLTITPIANAQSQTVTDRIDQAMEHLTGWLNLSTPITRQGQFWRWEEQVYPDSGFGCGVQGQTYPAEPNRALNIFIAYEGTNYNYRVSWDGQLLVLCGEGNVPLYRSDDPNLAPQPQPVTPPVAAVGADFYAWVYMATQQRFYLLNETGAVANIQRPLVSNEANAPTALTMSRDGRYLIQVAELTPGNEALAISDLATGQQRVIPIGTDETIRLGAPFDLVINNNNVSTATPLVTNAASTQIAVGIANATDPQVNEWRIAVIDLATGTIVNQLRSIDLPGIVQGADQALTDVINDQFGSFFALPVLFDDQGGIHFRLIRQFTGGSLTYPAAVWYPQAGTATSSPFVGSDMNLRPDGSTVYNVHDPNLPSADGAGMIPPFNAITRAEYLAPNPNERYIFGGSNDIIFNVQWADDTSLVLYRTTPDLFSDASTYYARQSEGDSIFVLPGKSIGVPGGALSVGEGTSGPLISYFDATSASATIWEAPPQNGDPIFVWTNQFEQDLGLTTLFDGQDVTTTAPIVGNPPVLDNSCGERPSIVQVGIIARSTIVDGSPLNVRDAPNTTTAQVARIIPENTRFNIIGGPECSNGYTWWQVQLDDGLVGWVAEAGSEFYFIEPAP